jgi:hypothetical protein
MSTVIESKVSAGAAGAAGGGVVATAALWLAGGVLWGAPLDAGHVQDAIAAVPAPVSALLYAAVPAAVAFWAGWRAKHTRRPDLGGGPDHAA